MAKSKGDDRTEAWARATASWSTGMSEGTREGIDRGIEFAIAIGREWPRGVQRRVQLGAPPERLESMNDRETTMLESGRLTGRAEAMISAAIDLGGAAGRGLLAQVNMKHASAAVVLMAKNELGIESSNG